MGEIRTTAGDARSTVHQAIENNPGPAGIGAAANGLGREQEIYRLLDQDEAGHVEAGRSLSDAMDGRVRRMIMIMIITDVMEWYVSPGGDGGRGTGKGRRSIRAESEALAIGMYQVQLQKLSPRARATEKGRVS